MDTALQNTSSKMGFFDFSVTVKLAARLQAWPLYASPKRAQVKQLEYASDRVRLPPCWEVVATLLFSGVAAASVKHFWYEGGFLIKSAWYSNCGSRVDFSIQPSTKSVWGNSLSVLHLPKWTAYLCFTPHQLCECHRDVMGRLKLLGLSDGVGGSNSSETVYMNGRSGVA